MPSFIGGASGTTSATIPTHQSGDLIIARAFRDGNNNAPTVPAGQNWTTIDTSAGANSNGAAIAYKFATSAGETTGTWTSATRLDVGVWRGFSTCAAHFSVDGNTGDVNYKTVTSFASGSWAIAFGAHRSINTSLETPPTGMVNRYTDVNSTDEGAIHDTNGTVSSWSNTSVVVGGTSSGWRTHVIEAVPGATNTTLTAGVGSYTITGTAATLHYGRKIAGDGGSYSVTGTDATLRYGRKLAAAVGSYTITGTAAGLKRAYTLAAAVGSYSISGTAAALHYGRTLAGAVGSYVITGTAATLRRAYTLASEVGSYILTGTDATLTQGTGSAWAASINFRATDTYVTDGTGETYCLGQGDTYPTTRAGITFGYTTTEADMGRDRDSGLDRRLAGVNQRGNDGTQAVFRLDLPSSGNYTIRLALGDGTEAQAYQRLDILDNTTLITSIVDGTGTAGAHFDDAAGNDRTAAAWPGSNTALTGQVFATSTFIFKLGATSAQSNSSTIAHLYVQKEVSSVAYTLIAGIGSYILTGIAATLTKTSVAAPSTFTGDIVPGDFSKTPVDFKTRGEKKRRTLPKSVVKKITVLAATEPTLEQLTGMAQAIMPQGGEDSQADMAMMILAGLNDKLNQAVIEELKAKQAAEELMNFRRRVIIEKVAAYLDALEQDEILLTYLI